MGYFCSSEKISTNKLVLSEKKEHNCLCMTLHMAAGLDRIAPPSSEGLTIGFRHGLRVRAEHQEFSAFKHQSLEAARARESKRNNSYEDGDLLRPKTMTVMRMATLVVQKQRQ